MQHGDLVADRFEIDRPLGSGGMGRVYRARDRLSGEMVALKLLHRREAQEMARFAREAQAIAALRHPGIVRYVAHGTTAGGAPYLAMEWLDGETLYERMARRPLTVAETMTVGMRLASALGEVHRRGMVHRDLKPSNIFLAGRALEGATLIDFGIARLPDLSAQLTVPGTMLGTPAYVAPEQARSAPDVDARADIFSLGCILFKALTGRGPFVGDDGLSVLLKVVLEEPPRLSELRPDVPGALDELVGRMLSKAPEKRPRDGAAAALELYALGDLGDLTVTITPPVERPPELGTGERRVMCLVLARDPRTADDETISRSSEVMRDIALRETVERHRGRLELLADRSLFVVLSGQDAGGAIDLAAQAARCALSIRAILEGVPVAVVTGRGVLTSRLPVGELIDRAVALLGPAEPKPPAIRIDEVTAGLLGTRFDVSAEGPIASLRGERDAFEAARTLLGRPSPCVGRERELALLEASFARASEESAASAVLVTGLAGMGKSRLGHELLRRLRERGEPVSIWIARGDPMSAGSAFGLLSQLIRHAVGVREGEPIEARRRKLRARAARAAEQLAMADEPSPAAAARIAEFLGELCGAPFPDEGSVQLRAARRDPMLMGDQMRRAFEDFLHAECAGRPVLLVLEDLHWGDLPTVKFVDAALRNLGDQPLMVLALTRPEVHELFPKLWAARGVQEITLGELSRRASERLVKATLGAGVGAELQKLLVDRGGGNAFYLEELIRAVAAGKGAALPETVLAMAQTRIEELDPEARRILRAASLFGQTFWRGGVSALLGGADPGPWLSALADQEMISAAREGRFNGEAEHGFRHALVREAAYGMLTEQDRSLGHRLAAEWLEQAGEVDAMVLAEHFERGGEPERAAAWFERAAAQAFEGNDLEAALRRAERGVACLGARSDDTVADSGDTRSDGERLGTLRVLQAQAHRWRGENAEAERSGLEAMARLPPGSPSWCDAAGEVVMAAGKLGHVYRVIETSVALGPSLDRAGGVSGPRVIAMTRAAVYLRLGGRTDLAEALLDEAAELSLSVRDDPTAGAQVESARASRALGAGDLGDYLRRMESSRSSFVQAGDVRGACTRSLNIGYAHLQLGEAGEAVSALAGAIADAERLGLQNVRTYGKHNLGLSLARLGRIAEARAAEEEAVAAFKAQGDRRMEAASRIYLAMILALGGDVESSAHEAIGVASESGLSPPLRASALATAADALLAQGQHGLALAAAKEAMGILDELSGIEDGESLIRLTYAAALDAEGRREEAIAAITDARDRLLARAAKVADLALRRSFLEKVPENARTLALARERLGVYDPPWRPS